MKVLIIGYSKTKQTGGGGAVAMNRLSELLTAQKIQNKLITKENFNTVEDADFFSVPSLLPDFKITLHSKQNISTVIDQEQADVIVLNSLEVNSWSIFDLLHIKKPIVWISHDNFLHTGGCLYIFENTSEECTKYKTQCGSCPLIQSKYEHDISTLQFKIKQKIYNLMPKIQFVAPSYWLKDKMSESALLNTRDIKVIPNPVNTNIYSPKNKLKSRQILKLPENKKIILFAGTSVLAPHKGFDLFSQAICSLSFSAKDLHLISIGHRPNNLTQIGKYMVHHLGFINDEEKQALIYSAADVVVVPSWIESFGFTAAESLACGTPVVAFNTSGLRDIIEHQKNGYLAKCFDPEDLKQGIEWVLNHKNYQELSMQATKKVKDNFSYGVLGEQYKTLFQQMIDNYQPIQYTQEVLDEINTLKDMTYSVLDLVQNKLKNQQMVFLHQASNPWQNFGQLNAETKLIFLLDRIKNKLKTDGILKTSKRFLKILYKKVKIIISNSKK